MAKSAEKSPKEPRNASASAPLAQSLAMAAEDKRPSRSLLMPSLAAFDFAAERAPPRSTQRGVVTYLDPEVRRALKHLAVQHDTSLQAITSVVLTEFAHKHAPALAAVLSSRKA